MRAVEPEVVVTGCGAVSAAGVGVSALWDAVLEARPATVRLTQPWLEGRAFHCSVGAPVGDVDLSALGYSPRESRWMDRVTQYALVAAAEALDAAGLGSRRREGSCTTFEVDGVDPVRAAVVVGSGMGGLGTLEAGHQHYLATGGATGAGPLRQTVVTCIPNAPAAQVALRYGLQGECVSVTTACAAGTMSLGAAWRLIRSGEADVVVAGGAEAILSDHDGLGLLGFDALRCLSVAERDPATASRPFDRDRDGFVLGDGAGVLVLERHDHAAARGVRPLARVLSYASTCQALSMVQPDASGARQARLVRLALERAGLEPSDLGAHVAHATSTPAGDAAEAAALHRALGAAVDSVLVTAPKGVIGHPIGAAGALETIVGVRALQHGVVPPTANLDEVGPGCELRHVRHEPAALPNPTLLKASFGFGGHDAALVLAAP